MAFKRDVSEPWCIKFGSGPLICVPALDYPFEDRCSGTDTEFLLGQPSLCFTKEDRITTLKRYALNFYRASSVAGWIIPKPEAAIVAAAAAGAVAVAQNRPNIVLDKSSKVYVQM